MKYLLILFTFIATFSYSQIRSPFFSDIENSGWIGLSSTRKIEDWKWNYYFGYGIAQRNKELKEGIFELNTSFNKKNENYLFSLGSAFKYNKTGSFEIYSNQYYDITLNKSNIKLGGQLNIMYYNDTYIFTIKPRIIYKYEISKMLDLITYLEHVQTVKQKYDINDYRFSALFQLNFNKFSVLSGYNGIYKNNIYSNHVQLILLFKSK